MLEAVKLPALVTGLDTGLAQMDRDALAHGWIGFGSREKRRGGYGGRLTTSGRTKCGHLAEETTAVPSRAGRLFFGIFF